ncbi:MAG TPA: GNAT family N-acetyltransferase [Actinomycetes bacterium]|nr:GNAT family N-acetyltransferase [Actinomycetes bacterium]
MQILRYEQDREALRPLFRLADDSEPEIDSYITEGLVIAATDGDEVVGYLQLTDSKVAGAVELKSMAVQEDRQREGVGRALVASATAHCQKQGASRLLVATASADIGNLRFYQRQGFRLRSVERNAFGPESGYAKGIVIDGIPLLDRVWLDLEL